MTRNKSIGDFGEDLAVKYFRKNGFKIIGRNVHEGKFEIDIIAENKNSIVFAEVKTRCVEKSGDIFFNACAALAVDQEKQKRTVSAARSYLSKYPHDKEIRFDVIEIYLKKDSPKKLIEINHIENAF